MSSHADTIRRALYEFEIEIPQAFDATLAADALAALDALVAENQQLRDAVASEIAVLDGYVADCCRDERRFCDEYGCSTIREIAGVLRAALDGTPSDA